MGEPARPWLIALRGLPGAGKSRLAFHGVTRTYPGTSTLLKNGGRINLTLRRGTA